MSSVNEYVYTFRIIVPDKSPRELEDIGEDLMDETEDTATPMIVSTSSDYMTLSLNEDTEFPDERLPYAMMLAVTALRDRGVQRPMFVGAYATLMDDEELEDVHDRIGIEEDDDDQDDIIDLTNELLQYELRNK